MADEPKRVERDLNEDPITGEHGAHPIGAGLGAAAGGAAAGAAGGAVAGPAGAVVGAIVGGIAGGLGGSALEEQIDPTVEYAHWEGEYKNRPYYDPDTEYGTYAPAYQHGWEGRTRYGDRSFSDAEEDLKREWEETIHGSTLDWETARPATRDAWERIDNIKRG
ncbi:hypothetical protein [Fuerstiella marisgermanici]|uniref:Glycine zipper domain-containing protein n=1 Tax=Fuerstiella marisgermanici TaxID=1891926 RepID=A0A1P8WCQ6_9PLAN|nr:hypothetical protein [Fuerstiella marisgermanici]APZ91835.1 hypothetical protein Fuma_01431 [Fuerstiella marisgermanici]